MPHFDACEKLGRLYRMRVRPAFFWPPTSSGGKGGWNLEKKATCEILKDRWQYFMTLICWVDWFWFAVCYFVVIVVVLSSWHAYGMVLVPCRVSRIPLPSRPPWWNACYTRYEVVDILLMTPSWRGEAARCKSCGFRTWCKSQRRWMHCTGQVKNGNGWSWVKGQDAMLNFRVCA